MVDAMGRAPIPFVVLLAVVPALALSQISMQPATPGGVSAPQQLFGTWGTAEQCEAHRRGVRDDHRLFPYVIDDQWLSQGVIWCRVTWLGQHGGGDTLRAQGYLQCGEDTLREYHVFFELLEQRLIMRWSQDFSTRALQRC